jgi:hypothetical protein
MPHSEEIVITHIFNAPVGKLRGKFRGTEVQKGGHNHGRLEA